MRQPDAAWQLLERLEEEPRVEDQNSSINSVSKSVAWLLTFLTFNCAYVLLISPSLSLSLSLSLSIFLYIYIYMSLYVTIYLCHHMGQRTLFSGHLVVSNFEKAVIATAPGRAAAGPGDLRLALQRRQRQRSGGAAAAHGTGTPGDEFGAAKCCDQQRLEINLETNRGGDFGMSLGMLKWRK